METARAADEEMGWNGGDGKDGGEDEIHAAPTHVGYAPAFAREPCDVAQLLSPIDS